MSETSGDSSFEPPHPLCNEESPWVPIPDLVYLGWELRASVALAVWVRAESHSLVLQVVSSVPTEEVWAPLTSDHRAYLRATMVAFGHLPLRQPQSVVQTDASY